MHDTATLDTYLSAYLQCGKYDMAEEMSGYKLSTKYPPAGFYVYALIDPRNGAIFYIGKGIGGRVLKHEERTRRGLIQNRNKASHIQEIFSCGAEVIKRVLFITEHEEIALAIEERTINTLKYSGLTNIIGGASSIPRLRNYAGAVAEKLQTFKEAWRSE